MFRIGAQPTTIGFLPPETMVQIFSFLPPSSLAQTSQVCKEWRELSEDEILWKKICVEKYGETKKENQTWREFAIANSAYWVSFKKGEILRRLPAIIEKIKRRSSIVDNGRFCCPAGKNVEIYNGRSKSELQVLFPHPEKVVKAILNDLESLCCTLDENNCVRVWDMKSQQCIYMNEIQDNLPSNSCLLNQKGNILITKKPMNGDRSMFTVHYLDRSKEEFSFWITAAITAMAVQENVLAAYEQLQDRAGRIYLINIEKMMLCSNNISLGVCNRLKWHGDTLHVIGFLSSKSVLTALDFSKAVSMPREQEQDLISLNQVRKKVPSPVKKHRACLLM